MSCRISRSFGTSVFSWLVALAALCVSGTCSAQAQFIWQGQPYTNSVYIDGLTGADLAETGAEVQYGNILQPCLKTSSECDAGPDTFTCAPSGAPTALGQTASCGWGGDVRDGPACTGGGCTPHGERWSGGMTLTSVSCAQWASLCSGATLCSGADGTGYASGLSGTGGVTQTKGGCVQFINPPGAGVCVGFSSGWTCSIRTYPAYENPGGGSLSGAAGPQVNCAVSAGVTACVQNQGSGKDQCGTFNGDQVCPSALPNNSCVFFASGGSACTVSGGAIGAGAPVDASGQPLGATGFVSNGAPGDVKGGVTANYYGPTVMAGASGAAGTPGGTNVGNGGSGGTGTGTQTGTCGSDLSSPCSVTNANASADGDCSSGDCSTGSNGMPTYDWSSDSWDGALLSFWNAVQGGPIGSAVGGISGNWPDGGSCPVEFVRISTLNVVADYGTPLCNVWEQDALPVFSAVMLAVWSITAVFIFLSA